MKKLLTFSTILLMVTASNALGLTGGCSYPNSTCQQNPTGNYNGEGVTCTNKDGNIAWECSQSKTKAEEECLKRVDDECKRRLGKKSFVACATKTAGNCSWVKGTYLPPYPLLCPGQNYAIVKVTCSGYCCFPNSTAPVGGSVKTAEVEVQGDIETAAESTVSEDPSF